MGLEEQLKLLRQCQMSSKEVQTWLYLQAQARITLTLIKISRRQRGLVIATISPTLESVHLRKRQGDSAGIHIHLLLYVRAGLPVHVRNACLNTQRFRRIQIF